jgi:hypothetical protein
LDGEFLLDKKASRESEFVGLNPLDLFGNEGFRIKNVQNKFTQNPNFLPRERTTLTGPDFFYTPFKANEETRTIGNYFHYLNTLLFIKKLDGIILDFLIT